MEVRDQGRYGVPKAFLKMLGAYTGRGETAEARPVLKWPGGKAWLAPRLAPVLRAELSSQGTYFEPCLGAGAVFFALRPKRALLSDNSQSLVDFFAALRDDPDAVLRRVWRFSNTQECYYRVRRMQPRTRCGEAARLLFLNRTCWGGVFRLNRDGEFNVPFGNSGRTICRGENLLLAAHALNGVQIDCRDFQATIAEAKSGDVVYADPPYTTLGQGNGFLRYNERLFKWTDQQRLAHSCMAAAERGAFVATSGLWDPHVLKLFPKWWAWKVERKSLVSRTPQGRRSVAEVVVFSRKPKVSLESVCQIHPSTVAFLKA